MVPFTKILVLVGSCASMGFGIWHFFVPGAWRWYSYIDVHPTELAAAIRATNNTLRTHTKSIFSKLRVNNRQAAVRRAEQLHLF